MATPTHLTPMLAQYMEIKNQYPDCIVFYRMGDFYEMFFDDALKAAPVLEVQLTTRDKNAPNPVPMCGIPHHAAPAYMQKLLAAGHKVALCEQVEDPAQAKGLVRRDVIRVVTPALVADPDLVPADQTYFLLSAARGKEGSWGVVLFNQLDNRLRLGTCTEFAQLAEVLRDYQPRELLLCDALAEDAELVELAGEKTRLTLRSDYFSPEGLTPLDSAKRALGLYLQETQKSASPPALDHGTDLFNRDRLRIDSVSAAALEINRPAQTGGKCLAGTVDQTVTPMGRRLLREWLSYPERDLTCIETRLDTVAALVADPGLGAQIRALLGNVRDLERLNTKTSLGLAMPRDLVAIRDILCALPEIKALLDQSGVECLIGLSLGLDPLESLTRHLQSALEDNAPAGFRDGGIFRAEFDPRIAEYRELAFDAKSTIAAMEERERTRTGISSLKIKFSKVFGYTIEITKSHLDKAPADYTRKQTISTGERFITQELKAFEEKIISAEHRLKTLEEALFLEARAQVAGFSDALATNAATLARLDVLLGFARWAAARGYSRPKFNRDGKLEITEGRHPVVETLLPAGAFVPNTLSLDPENARTLIITGPNMGGKSTIMRQAALTCILAQAGSFVPAASANLPLLDAVFTRIGSSDDLSRGQSTFLVEMTEVSRILQTATPDSLVLIDEIGRGTSTYDGLSLAWSLLEYLHQEVRAKTLFATHFHEVTALEGSLPGLRNVHAMVEKWHDEVVFLYKLGAGVCNRSYGIEVAKIAGLPGRVLVRAREIQGFLESQSHRASRGRNGALQSNTNQMAFFDDPAQLEKPAPLEGR